ncbi:DNA-formamidopyrimidine glycosylase [candidate division CPR3 bacterium GWF2_35_18]|uniref:Formamidopyrimidine-DNA glycosylase (Fapy-DNA glycosylase) n=1 Tax=candidate division CPR3 bacterium GW2011_GWF2_35_18 TaxID=1618350 RepID=A0A0G0E3E7_UNCC3|nr:MAG: Formamidopyrimidine-DNA glycosylase (Fapy-DNA glycosylase) [candidate division CPR3 bacterium GW2011_GWF2_35_18]KKP87259.1 MAG: Formamidopyrimidine-DNA glycosylase (Fapy-DNA glycosylase) [candidate division CPR3 bacterium GW2011_GWE2_35_7]OGB63694.1 MAG: DNA-formamidopyrimidine glycosylase [candidate division CPR3 bacterium GWF2_35_18]OGB64986.1 MAG: DNA-formamidopyrimidine glycosylase [candidate division CPR3 bacterium RIFOXYA2_FULL_35_13]OGB78531.1 MAG: DNA-formamidopyrimidine glycosy
MPELPEVETVRYDLNKSLSGFQIKDISCNTTKILQPSLKEVIKHTKGLTISSFNRKAKLLIVELNKDWNFLIHLKMSGRLLIRDPGGVEDRWTRVIIALERKGIIKELRFADQRKFGYIKLIKKEELSDILSNYGPEPFADLSLQIFTKILKSSRRAIKKVLMDQVLISGIGNIYANDALFLAKIHPETSANYLNQNQIKNLFEAIEEVLKRGLKYRGASDNSYLDAFGKKGQYQEHFLVYGKNKENCPNCGSVIQKIVVGGRGTFYCPKCQLQERK